MKIAFIHPDLGVGGAERVIVDAAVALIGEGHDVTVWTSQFSENHCFAECLKMNSDGRIKIAGFLP